MGFISLFKKYNRYKINKSRSTYYQKKSNYYDFMMNYKKRKSK